MPAENESGPFYVRLVHWGQISPQTTVATLKQMAVIGLEDKFGRSSPSKDTQAISGRKIDGWSKSKTTKSILLGLILLDGRLGDVNSQNYPFGRTKIRSSADEGKIGDPLSFPM